jgi:hypothetical protein
MWSLSHIFQVKISKWQVLKQQPFVFEMWKVDTSLVCSFKVSFSCFMSMCLSSVKPTYLKTTIVFYAKICHGTMLLWCSTTINIICNQNPFTFHDKLIYIGYLLKYIIGFKHKQNVACGRVGQGITSSPSPRFTIP